MVAREKNAGLRDAGARGVEPRDAGLRDVEPRGAGARRTDGRRASEGATDGRGVSRRGMLGLLAGMAGVGALLQLGDCSSDAGGAQQAGAPSGDAASADVAAAPEEAQLEVPEDRLMDDCKASVLDGAQLAADPYLTTTVRDLELEGVEDVSEQVEGTTLTARFTAVCSTGQVELRRGMVATYEGGPGSWEYKDAQVVADRYRAVSGIEKDPLGRFGAGASVSFDEGAQTCRVDVDPEAQWFETIEGTFGLRYSFGTCQWWFDDADTSAAKVSFQNLLGEYVDPDNRDLEDDGCKLEITDVADDGTVTARLTVRDVDGGSSLFGIAPTDNSDTATMSGKMHYRVIADGTHRVGGMLRGKGDKSGRDFAWYFRADGKVTSGHGYTKVLRVVSTEGSPLPSNGLLEVPEAQSATGR